MSAPAPIVVAGMHRSGTSLVASWIEALGVDVGTNLLAADAANPRGYFEDRDFVALHQRMFADATRADDGGHRDWGWTEHAGLDGDAVARHRPQALELVEARRALARPWGWKDPRTTLVLDFWQPLVPDARYVFTYRRPWDVADSMERLGADVFIGRPDYAFAIWRAYNQALLAFLDRHPERCLLLCVHALAAQPDTTARALAAFLGAADADRSRHASARLEHALLRTRALDDPWVRLCGELHPECVALLGELDRRAAVPPPAATPAPRPAAIVTAGAPPRVSVVVPFHDDRELVLQAIASVERHLSVPYELLVVNDGTTEPDSLLVLDFLREQGYRVLDRPQGGLGAARNTGLEAVEAPFVLPLDADNRLLPGFVEAGLARLAATPRAAAVYGDRVEFGLRQGTVSVPECEPFALLRGNTIDACALLRRAALTECGGYADDLGGWEDWDLWLRLLERDWTLEHLALPAYEYRVRPSSLSSRLLQPEVGRAFQAEIVRRNEALYRRHLPELLLRAQDADRREGTEAALAAALAAAETARGELAALRSWATAHTTACAVEHARLAADNAALAAALARERERAAALERPRGARARAFLARLLRGARV